MLNHDALTNALPLTGMLDARRTILLPIAGSPLEVLNNATRYDKKFLVRDANGEPSPDTDTISFMANARENELGFSEHDIRMDEMVPDCITAVQNHIRFARTVVSPAVSELAESVVTTLNETKTVSSLLGMEVVVWNPCALLSNSAFESDVRKLENVAFADPKVNFNLPAMSYDELVKLMQTGKSSIDSDIATWAASKGQNFFLNIWSTLFQRSGDYQPNFQAVISDKTDGGDYAIAIYLMARRLYNDVPENTGMSLSEYNNSILDYIDQSALRICLNINEIKRDLAAGRLVRSATDRVTVVNGPVYKDWLAAGGEIEILFGNMLNQPPVFTANSLLDNKAKLLDLWHKHEYVTKISESTNKYNRLIAALRAGFQRQLMHLAAEENNIDNLTTINKLFEEQLAFIGINDTDNIYRMCLRLICRSRFYRTAAEDILGSGDRIVRENPGIDIREAFAMSTAEYVVDWVVSQIKPVAM